MKDLEQTFININNHLEDYGMFVGSIAQFAYFNDEGINLHVTSYPEIHWYNNLFPSLLKNTNLTLYQYPFDSKVREDKGSFYIALVKDKLN